MSVHDERLREHPERPPHAGASMRPGERAPLHAPRPGWVRVRVWDRVVRTTHWLIVFSMAFLFVTGLYIGNPFITVSGPARESFVMGTMKIVHSYSAIVFTLAVLSRIVWMFVGRRHARWTAFVPTTRAVLRDMKDTFLFYIFVKQRPPMAVGHNPLAGATYAVVFGLYLVMIATGLGLYSVSAHVDSPMGWFGFLLPVFGGVPGARLVHHVAMWLLVGFAVHHVYSSVLMSLVERNGTVGSIFTGDKWVPPDLADREPEETRS
ncbi:MAG: Ni/Fe-hydrogenase, b-type cytochrome subunit [Myxococcota bacterium]